MVVQVVEVSSQKAIQVFNTFPRVVYRGSYIAPFFPVLERSSTHYDPLFAEVEAQPFLALKNGRAAGRIAAGIHHGLPDNDTGYFGYFESINDPTVSAALLQAAAGWLAARGKNRMTGPVELSPHERLGLLVEGFSGYHHPSMPYNPPYYAELLDRCGLKTEVNLYAYHYDLRRPAPVKLARVATRAGRIPGFCLRQINFNDPAGEGEIFSRIHNDSMNELWGFVSLSPREGAAIWRKLRTFYDPDLILVAEISGEPVGLCLALCPATRSLFSRLPGRLNVRLAVLAVLPCYRFKGLESALILELSRRARSKGIPRIEFSLVAENNFMMNRIIQSMEGVIKNRIYRVYKGNTNDFE